MGPATSRYHEWRAGKHPGQSDKPSNDKNVLTIYLLGGWLSSADTSQLKGLGFGSFMCGVYVCTVYKHTNKVNWFCIMSSVIFINLCTEKCLKLKLAKL